MSKILTIEQQISILEQAKKLYKESTYPTGLCYELTASLCKNKYLIGRYPEICSYIPSFNLNNAIELSEKYGFTKPTGSDYDFWWKEGFETPRIMFIDALIEELRLEQGLKPTIQEQIEILTEVRLRIKDGRNTFVCCAISDSIFEKYSKALNSSDIPKIFDILTIENATIACREKHLTLPKLCLNNAWWLTNNRKSRMAFINWMIKTLKERL